VVSAAHAQAAREQEAQHEEEGRRGQLQPDEPVRRKRSGRVARRVPNAANGATSPEAMLQSELPAAQSRQEHWSDVDAEFDTSPLPRLTASGAIATPEVNNVSPPSARTAAPNDAVKPDPADKQRHAARPEQERGGQHKRTARQARIADRKHAAEQDRTARQEQERAAEQRARLEQERAAEERAQKDEERAAQEQARQEQERAAEQRARLEQERARLEQERAAEERAQGEEERAAQERAAQEQARLEQERGAQERARQERARQEQESLARQERRRAAKLERTAQRGRAAERRRAVKLERERAAQELIEQKRAAEERAHQEQERAAEELARQLEELAARERVRQEQEREDREWAAQRRARLEREREEAEELARREQGHAAEPNGTALPGEPFPISQPSKPNGTAQPSERRLAAFAPTAAVPTGAGSPEQRQPRGQEASGLRRYRMPALVTAAAVLLVSVSLIVGRSLHSPAPTAGADIGTATQKQAAAWVAQQVSPSAVVSCDPAMCLVLKAQGVPTYDLNAIEPNTPNPFGSHAKVVLASAALRDQFGGRLATVYAPVVIASFGSGKARIDVRVVTPRGAAAYLSDLKVDQQERQTAEAAFLASERVTTSATAREQLAAGEVDSRLMFLISFMMTSISQVDIVAFGDLGPGASAGIPLRSATLTGTTASLKSIVAFVHKQAPLYRPLHTAITQRDGKPALVIEFSAPSPLGLFGPGN